MRSIAEMPASCASPTLPLQDKKLLKYRAEGSNPHVLSEYEWE
jgi:hypothetical protein